MRLRAKPILKSCMRWQVLGLPKQEHQQAPGEIEFLWISKPKWASLVLPDAYHAKQSHRVICIHSEKSLLSFSEKVYLPSSNGFTPALAKEGRQTMLPQSIQQFCERPPGSVSILCEEIPRVPASPEAFIARLRETVQEGWSSFMIAESASNSRSGQRLSAPGTAAGIQ